MPISISNSPTTSTTRAASGPVTAANSPTQNNTGAIGVSPNIGVEVNKAATKTPNTPLSQIQRKQTITLSTLDENNNNAPISEGYDVSGPTGTGINVIPIVGTNKVVVQLTGAYYLKIHFPDSSNINTMYLTYAKADSTIADGYLDYVTGVPTAFVASLKTWIAAVYTGAISNTTAIQVVRTLNFSAFGSTTNKPGEAVSFSIKFQTSVGGPAVVTTSTTGTGTILPPR